MTNITLHEDLKVTYIQDEMLESDKKYQSRLENDVNMLFHLEAPVIRRLNKMGWMVEED